MNPLSAWSRRALCVPIRWYQKWISPGLGRNCRFTPSCSQYAIEAIQTHGCIKGLLLAAARIARCNPLGRWGYDPVPGARPLAQPGPEAFSGQTVFHKTRKISGKQTSPSRLRRATAPNRGG